MALSVRRPKMTAHAGSKMIKFIISIAATAALSSPAAFAQTSNKQVCRSLSQAIEQSLMEMSAQNEDDFGDNSAPRSTMRAAKSAMLVQLISANLHLLSTYSCPLPDFPIGPDRYGLAARMCKYAHDERQTEINCDRTRWRPLTGVEGGTLAVEPERPTVAPVAPQTAPDAPAVSLAKAGHCADAKSLAGSQGDVEAFRAVNAICDR